MKKLYCCGDSFTDKTYWSREYQQGLTTSWPDIVKEKLGKQWQLYNGAYSGASNGFIVRDFFNYVALNGNPDAVFIAWTNAGRVDHFNGNDKRTGFTRAVSLDPIGHWNNSVHKENKHKVMIQAAVDLGKEIIKKNMWNRYMEKSINDWLTTIFIIQNYCETNRINYVFIQAICPVEFPKTQKSNISYIEEVIKTLINEPLFYFINEENFVYWPVFGCLGGSTIADWTRDTTVWTTRSKDKLSFGIDDNHPNDKGHEMIAKKVYEVYCDNYIRV